MGAIFEGLDGTGKGLHKMAFSPNNAPYTDLLSTAQEKGPRNT